MKLSLTSIALAGALALGGAGCASQHQKIYDYNGMIGSDHIVFKGDCSFETAVMKVTKTNGDYVLMMNKHSRFPKIDEVTISTDGDSKIYTTHDKNSRPVIEYWRNQFTNNLSSILRAKEESLHNDKSD